MVFLVLWFCYLQRSIMSLPFDFSVKVDYGQEDFNNTVVNSDHGIKEVVNSGGRDSTKAYMACSLFVNQEGDGFTSSHWVGDGALEAGTAVTLRASSLFPTAPKSLFLSLRPTLQMFAWPGNGSNFSHYVEAPRDLVVGAYTLKESGETEWVDWERAKAMGCSDFCLRAVVLPGPDPKYVLLQLGASPFPLKYLEEHYAEVFNECYFPNFMLTVSKTPTKLPEGSKSSTSRLVKAVELVVFDVKGFGLGTVPFFNVLRFHPTEDPIPMVPFPTIREAVFAFMRQGRLPVAKGVAALPAALAVAKEADKNPSNLSVPVSSPWPVPNSTAGMRREFLGEYRFTYLMLVDHGLMILT